MKKIFLYIITVILSIAITLFLYAMCLYSKAQAQWLSDNRPSDITFDSLFAEKFPFSNFVINNNGFVDFISVLPLMCLVASITFFVRRQLKWGVLMVMFPSVLVLPIVIGIELEFQSINMSTASMMSEYLKGNL